MTSLLDRAVPAPDDAPRSGGRLSALRSRLPGDTHGRRERSDLLPRPPHVRRRRRRLVLASLPVAVLLVLVAARLLTLNVVHDRTLGAYTVGDAERTMTWAQRQGWVNVVEQFRAPFAVGDAHILTGHYALARPWFEQAFELVPKGGIDDCKVRVNLGLTYEALGDDAKARERTDEWKQFYDKGIRITKERPPLCEAPEGGQTGDQLQQAQQRMEQKNADAPPDQGQGNEDQPQPGPTPQPTPTPDPNQTPSQEKQDYLQQQQRQNTIERNQQQGQDDRIQPGDGGQTYPKPW